jgi:endonuclease YncB( thermonuclease family)
MLPFVTLAVLCGCRGSSLSRDEAAPRTPTEQTGVAEVEDTTTSVVGRVTSVVDGDTLYVAGVKVRVIGIDTPERGVCGYSEASERMGQLVDGRTVSLIGAPGQTLDRYRRTLGYVEVGGVDVGAVLIREGLARARYDSRDGYPGHPREAEYRDLDASTPDPCGSASTTQAPPVARYGSCAAARAAGAAPVRAGDPGYASDLDGDHDGVGCE